MRRIFTLRAPRRGGDRESFRASFRENSSKNLILQNFRTHRDIENYAPSKFQPRTTLGGAKNVKKTKKKKLEFFMISEFSFSLFLIVFGGARLFLTSKSSSSRFFALDGQIFRSVRRLELIFGFFTVRTSTCGEIWAPQSRGRRQIWQLFGCWPEPTGNAHRSGG